MVKLSGKVGKLSLFEKLFKSDLFEGFIKDNIVFTIIWQIIDIKSLSVFKGNLLSYKLHSIDVKCYKSIRFSLVNVY